MLDMELLQEGADGAMRMPRERFYRAVDAAGLPNVIAGSGNAEMFLAGMVKEGMDQRQPQGGIKQRQIRKPYRLLDEAY